MNLIRSKSPLLLLLLFLLLPRVANACGCFPNTTVLDEYNDAGLVVIARVTAVTKGSARFLGNISQVTMTVQKVFKGKVKAGATLTFSSGDPILDCSWDFYENKVGETYLLYLDPPEKSSEPFSVSTCRRSNSVENAKEDLLYLENMDKLRGRTRVSGVVARNIDDYEAGQQVRIVGKNKTYIATTDEDGVFEIYDLPPGRYSIGPVLQPGWKVDEWITTREKVREWKREDLGDPLPDKVWFTLRARKHFGVKIELDRANE